MTAFIYYLYSVLVLELSDDQDFLLLCLVLLDIFIILKNDLDKPTKADPEIELRFLLRQFNRRLRMDQLKEIIGIAKEDNQQAALKLMEYLNK
ncbi:MAG: hypothetical protein EZS28_017141 [Streblomastix strix]|uniref:Uncharacterized protein n=1 Tax=Streblomastix strix TaxID=222440 RepID=A0A5J4VXG2_9EUKA|nr:MAG: hypothetical protein EZS28_017141 [Streblomastix strix]